MFVYLIAGDALHVVVVAAAAGDDDDDAVCSILFFKSID